MIRRESIHNLNTKNMKKIILLTIAALCAFTAVSAQDKGNWGVGPQIGIYTNTGADGAIFGIGATGRYSFTDTWRIQPSLTALCKSGCSVDIAADVQYLFEVASSWDVYPQAGLSANDIGGWSCGINLGAGTDFNVARNWDLSAGFKWMIQTTDYVDEGAEVGLYIEPDAIHIMKKSEYSGMYGDYSSFSNELDELSDAESEPDE